MSAVVTMRAAVAQHKALPRPTTSRQKITVDSHAISTGCRPRWYQRDIHAGLRRFSVLVLHRRAGKTVLAVNALIDAALRCEKPNPRFAYLAPYQKQAKQIAWDTLRSYCRPIPGIQAGGDCSEVTPIHIPFKVLVTAAIRCRG